MVDWVKRGLAAMMSIKSFPGASLLHLRRLVIPRKNLAPPRPRPRPRPRPPPRPPPQAILANINQIAGGTVTDQKGRIEETIGAEEVEEVATRESVLPPTREILTAIPTGKTLVLGTIVEKEKVGGPRFSA